MYAPVLILLLPAFPAAADVVHLRNGGRVEGRVTDRGDRLEVDTGRGLFRVDKADVVRLEPKPWTPPPGEKPPDAAPVARPAETPARLDAPYSHPFLAFTFRPPLGWKAGEPAAAAALSFYGPAEQFYVPRLDIVHVYLRDGDQLDDFLATWKAGHARSFPGWTVVSEELTGVHGVLGKRIVSTLGGESAPLKNLSIALWKGRRVFVLSFTTGRGYFDRYAPLVERSLRTFRIFAEPALDEAGRKNFQARYNAAAEALAAGRKEEAAEGFRACAKILPAFADVHRAIGNVCADLGREDEAAAAYRRAIAIDPDHADAHFNLGTLLLRQENTAEAVRMLRKAVALEPEHERAWINLGAAHAAREEWGAAREALEKGCLLAPESVPAHLGLARAYEKLGDAARALREYRDVLQLDPAHAGAKEAVARLAPR